MTVHKDPNTNNWFYSVRVENVQGEKVHKKKRGFAKKKDALIAQQKFLETYDTDIEEQYTFREIAERFMRYSKGRKKETTIYNQNNLINHILIPHFKTTPIKNIKPKHIDDFYQSIFDKYSNSMLSNIRRNLSAIFNFAVNFYNLSRNVVKVVSLPKHEERRKQEYWTIDEFNHFINVVDNIVYKTLFMVLFWSGARKGEILALRYCDVDFENEEIEINNSWNDKTITTVKTTPSERTITIPKHVIEQLKELEQYQIEKFKYVNNDDFIFTVRSISKPMALANVNKQFKIGIDKANVKPIRVHNLRHSHATLLINNNVQLYTISKHLGHSDITTTANTYGHLYPNTEKELQSVLTNAYKNSF